MLCKFLSNFLCFAIVYVQCDVPKIPTQKLIEGVEMPVIGYGTWQAKDDSLEKGLNLALEAGYRHIDTAYVYENEKVVGKVLKEWFTSGKLARKDVFVTTKLPGTGNHAEEVPKYLNESLANLQLDYVDLYLIHIPFGYKNKVGGGKADPDPTTDHLKIWKAMEDQVRRGKAKTIGLSNFNQTQVKRVLDNCTIKPTCLQVEIHAYLQQHDLVDFCKRNDIVVVAYSPLGSPGSKVFLEKFGEKRELPNLFADATVMAIAKKYNKSPAQVLLRHGIQKGLVVIPKSTTEKRIKENIDIFDFVLTDDEIRDLNKLDKNIRIATFTFVNGVKEHPEYPFRSL